MTNKEESSFLQGVESRLDSLFAEDPKLVKQQEPVALQTAVKDVAGDIVKEELPELQTVRITTRETGGTAGGFELQDQTVPIKDAGSRVEDDFREIPPLSDTIRKEDISSDPVQAPDKSTFISEIEKRFTAIFGDDDKGVGAVKETEDRAGGEESSAPGQSREEVSPPPSTVIQSPLKDLKGIVLSLEWEINDQILEQLEEEVNKLHLLYTGDRIIQGFLRILRFVERYLRVRGARSNQDSVTLLMSVYDHLEHVMVSEDMTEAKRHVFLMENIRQYRSWVENTDIGNPQETTDSGAPDDEIRPLEMESSEGKFHESQKAEEEPLTASRFAEEKQFVETASEQHAGDEFVAQETAPEPGIELVVENPELAVERQPAVPEEMPPGYDDEDTRRAIAAIRDLPPEEAYAYVFTEVKKTFQDEINALKEEIRFLKNAG